MIKFINIFIAQLIKQHHDVIMFIDVNVKFILGNNGVSKLTSYPSMIDPFIDRHNIKYEPHTYKRGLFRMDFLFCTKIINQYIKMWNPSIRNSYCI